MLVRVVEPLAEPAPPRWTVVLDRGPYSVGGERDLMRRHRVDVLVTKDSGGGYTSAKLDAAAEPRRPGRRGVPTGTTTGLVTTADVAGCVTWLGVRRRRSTTRRAAALRAATMTPSAISPMRRSSRTADPRSSTVTAGPSPRRPRSSTTPACSVGAPERDTQRRRKGSPNRSGIQTGWAAMSRATVISTRRTPATEPVAAAVLSTVSRAGIQLATSSSLAAAQPNSR